MIGDKMDVEASRELLRSEPSDDNSYTEDYEPRFRELRPYRKPAKYSILKSLHSQATKENCDILASTLWTLALAGHPKAMEIILERLEGKVPLTLQHETEIVVRHNIPSPDGDKLLAEPIDNEKAYDDPALGMEAIVEPTYKEGFSFEGEVGVVEASRV